MPFLSLFLHHAAEESVDYDESFSDLGHFWYEFIFYSMSFMTKAHSGGIF